MKILGAALIWSALLSLHSLPVKYDGDPMTAFRFISSLITFLIGSGIVLYV